MDYKLKGNIAGYIAVFIQIVIFVLTMCFTAIDVHFRYDCLTIVLLLDLNY